MPAPPAWAFIDVPLDIIDPDAASLPPPRARMSRAGRASEGKYRRDQACPSQQLPWAWGGCLSSPGMCWVCSRRPINLPPHLPEHSWFGALGRMGPDLPG